MAIIATVEIDINTLSELQRKEVEYDKCKEKADKWDALAKEVEGEYINPDTGEEWGDEPDQDHDLTTIGLIAATAFGWL
jgi:hypothetical protein